MSETHTPELLAAVKALLAYAHYVRLRYPDEGASVEVATMIELGDVLIAKATGASSEPR